MSIEDEARTEALTKYSHQNVRDRYDADLMMVGFVDGAEWQASRKPGVTDDMVGTVAELDALPRRSVVLDVRGRAYQKTSMGWEPSGVSLAYGEVAFPATVLWVPDTEGSAEA